MNIALIIFSLLLLIGGALYFYQEKLIFFPQQLEKDFQFQFEQEFEELNIQTKDGKLLNGLLFKAEKSKGLVFYLHGNAGNLNNWGDVAEVYTDLNYDVFIWDYRGFGKSDGKINGQKQLFEDSQLAYDELKKRYTEEEIIVLGHSVGTGLASKLASTNHPKRLILITPYYNFKDLVKSMYPFAPSFILKYKLQTNEYLKKCEMPVVLVHGDEDEVIYYGSALKLKQELKPTDRLVTLKGQGHNGITENDDYRAELKSILEE